MTIDLTPLLSGERSEIALDFTVMPELGDDAPFALVGIRFPDGIRAVGKATDNAGYISLQLTITVPWQGECVRCLAPVDGLLSFPFKRTVAVKGTLENEEEIADYSEEYLIAENGRITPDREIIDSITFELPAQVLCTPDCPRLCPRCGKPKRDGDCGCETDRHDPRWDVLKTMKLPDEPQGK